jgi:GT2 family glycosyltransferase
MRQMVKEIIEVPTQVDLSIIIVSWNTKDLTLQCLKSAIGTRDSYTQEIIVVDNASSDGSAEAIKSEYPDVIVIKNDKNYGFARANNIGIKRSSGKYVCLINSDVQVLDRTIKYMIGYMDNNPAVGIAGPKILSPDMTLQDSCRQFPTLWNKLCDTMALRRVFPKSAIFSGEHMMFFAHDRLIIVDSLAGCFMLIRRTALREIGLFDEQYFIYSEETDLCKRFHMAGWDIVFLPEVSVIHQHAASTEKDPVRFAIEQQKSLLKYWTKHHSLPSMACLFTLLLIHHTVRYASGRLTSALVPGDKAIRRIEQHRECLKALLSSDSLPISH